MHCNRVPCVMFMPVISPILLTRSISSRIYYHRHYHHHSKRDESNTKWIHHRGTVHHPPEVEDRFSLWAYPTSFDVDPRSGTMWLVDMEANSDYLASGIWRSTDEGQNWFRVKQFTFPYHVVVVGDRVYASGGRSISMTGHAGTYNTL